MASVDEASYSLITLFLYMVAELAALRQIIVALTPANGLPVVIVECAVTTIYTCKINSYLFPNTFSDIVISAWGFSYLIYYRQHSRCYGDRLDFDRHHCCGG